MAEGPDGNERLTSEELELLVGGQGDVEGEAPPTSYTDGSSGADR